MSTSIFGVDGQAMPDTYAIASEPTRTHNRLTYVHLDTSTSFGYWTASLTGIPRDAVIDSAIRYDYTAGNWGGTYELTTLRADDGFDVGDLTWNNKPGTNGTGVAVSHNVSAVGTEYAFDLTDKIQACVTAGVPANFVNKLTSGTGPVRATSMEWGGSATPMLIVEWHAAGQKPSKLSPNGFVGTDKPRLSGFPKDSRQVRVQIKNTPTPFDDDAGFTLPDWESSTQDIDGPQYDLETSTYPGGAPNDDQWWIVSTKDASGNWSKFSDPISFAYSAVPDLTITAPSAAFPVVTDDSPTITWDSPDQTQWRVELVKTDGSGDTLYDSKWQVGTDSSHTIPTGYLKDRTVDGYRVYVSTNDDVERVAAGALPYAREGQVFTFQEAGGVPPVSYFVAEQIGNGPQVQLTWYRQDGAPDHWLLWRDNQVLARLDPEDVDDPDMGGWAYIDSTWTPGVEHTWYVEPIVNGHLGESGPRDTHTFTVVGHWLLDADNDFSVMLANADSTSYQSTDQVTMVQPLGSAFPVGLSTALGGLRGTITGLVSDWMDRTLDDWLADWQSIRRNRLRTITYVTGMLSFPVVVWDMTLSPEPRMARTFRLSCQYAQVDDLTITAELPDGTELLEPPDPDVEYTYAAYTNGHVLIVGEEDITAVTGTPTVQTALSIHSGMKGWS